jgi:uncharacterized cupredoxin-like copper-binding protein
MKRALLIAPLVMTVFTLAIACSSGDDESTTPTPTATEADGTTTATPTDTGGTSTPLASPTLTSGDFEVEEFTVRPHLTRARPGTVTFDVLNTGEIAHQFVVVASDLPAAELPRAANGVGVDESQIEIVGRLDGIAPGTTDQISLDLTEGKYLLICNITAGDDSHYINGMYTPFTVSTDAPAPVPEAPSE